MTLKGRKNITSRIEKDIADIAVIADRLEAHEEPEPRTGTVRWIKENLWIRPKKGGKAIRFDQWRRAQKRLIAYFVKCEKLGKPIRVWVLKGRQFGISTITEAYLFERAHRIPERTSFVVAHLDTASQTIFRSMNLYYDKLPESEKLAKPLKGGKVHHDHFEYLAPHRSDMHVATGKTTAALRAPTIHDIHFSEVAFMTDPLNLVNGGLQAVPDPEVTPLTCVVGESTANGKNYFYEQWWKAYRPEPGEESDWHSLFFSWLDEEECRIPIRPGEVFELDEQEKEYAAKYGADLEQMKWARQNRKTKCHNDWKVFNRENPAVPELAFYFSGYPWFEPDIMNRDLKNEKVPLFVGNIDWISTTKAEAKLVDDPYGPLQIYHYPEPDMEYVVGGDIGFGVEADSTEFVVMRRKSPVVCAHYRSNRVMPRQASVPAYLLGLYYNRALLGIESNGPGITTLDHLARGHPDFPQMGGGYDPVYKEIRVDKQTKDRTEQLGWGTRRKNKERALSGLTEGYATGKFEINSRSILLQMSGLSWDPVRLDWVQNYKDPKTGLYHDDGIIALAIANQMRRIDSAGSYFGKPQVAEW